MDAGGEREEQGPGGRYAHVSYSTERLRQVLRPGGDHTLIPRHAAGATAGVPVGEADGRGLRVSHPGDHALERLVQETSPDDHCQPSDQVPCLIQAVPCRMKSRRN